MGEAPQLRTTMNFAYGAARELAPGVVRLVANNPGPFTFKGTNTYLVGGSDMVLIDPGPEDAAHLRAILETLGKRRLSHILITHTHRDHVDGLAALAAATGAKTAGYGRRAIAPGTRRTSASGSEYVDQDFVPDVRLDHGDRLAGEGWALTALHTPGHAPDHLCFELEGTGLLFSGDHVMGWNTSVIAPPEGSMADYLRSLERLGERGDRVYLPGHGGRVEEPQRLVKAFLLHRRMREQSILDCIRSGTNTVAAIVPAIYRDLDPKLTKAASLSVLAHVEHLISRGLVRCDSPLSVDRALFAA
ncbi:MAG TPA: MBL fold metallo-hydrolase [Hyphomicrobiaceae bacterium]|jgi:glyoxylase-like metal-dependent hydrolase (beta-lactamase superfamily II)|nr:MBL fold metallo-hydrolase [Hyphomicrobiaceae bacterium]